MSKSSDTKTNANINISHCNDKVEQYPKMDQKVCLYMAKKDQLCASALKKRN